MKKISLIFSMLLIFAVVTPVIAAPKAPIGEAINLFLVEDLIFTSETPFHIKHGWAMETGYPPGRFAFQLEVDDVYISETYVDRTFTNQDGLVFDLVWVFNFPDGMTGVHTFTGHWLCPCEYAIELGYSVTCTNPYALTETLTKEITVTFAE